MYQNKPLNPLIDDKCDSCQFCVWDSERHEYGCEIHDCYYGERFIEWAGADSNNDKS